MKLHLFLSPPFFSEFGLTDLTITGEVFLLTLPEIFSNIINIHELKHIHFPHLHCLK